METSRQKGIYLELVQWLEALYGGAVLAESGMYVADVREVTIAVRIEESVGVIRFYADIGLLCASDELSACRAALQANLVRGIQRVTFGMHAESLRLIATSALPVDVDWKTGATARTVIENLLAAVADMRRRFTFYGS
jgi:hypothetical protein